MDESNVIYSNDKARDSNACAYLQVLTDEVGETIMTVAEFERALSLLVGMVHVDITMADVKAAIVRVLAIYPY